MFVNKRESVTFTLYLCVYILVTHGWIGLEFWLRLDGWFDVESSSAGVDKGHVFKSCQCVQFAYILLSLMDGASVHRNLYVFNKRMARQLVFMEQLCLFGGYVYSE